MFTQSYHTAVLHAASLAPTLPEVNKPGRFFEWQEDIVELLSFIYAKDLEEVLNDLVEEVKQFQYYEDDENDED